MKYILFDILVYVVGLIQGAFLALLWREHMGTKKKPKPRPIKKPTKGY